MTEPSKPEEALSYLGRRTFDELDIPPCVVDIRLEHSDNRAARNTSSESATDAQAFSMIRYENAGDGDAYFVCGGNGADCEGGRVKVDRHDLVQPSMPLTSAALGAICTSRTMYARSGTVLHRYEVID